MTSDIENELSTLGARDAFILAAICVPPERLRTSGHKGRHALLLRIIGARRSMKRLEERGCLEPAWTVDYLGAHCEVTEVGTRLAKAVAATVNVAPQGGPVSTAAAFARLLLNLRVRT